MSKSKNNNQKQEVKNTEVVEEKVEVKSEEATKQNTPNIPEHSDKVREIVERSKEAVGKFERGWSIKNLDPIKEDINNMLSENRENEFLSKSDRNFLYFVNRVIYGKVEPPAWRRNNQEEQAKESNRPENAPKQLQFRTLNDKMSRLKQVLEGYGNKSIITTIEDVKENSFYCLKETEIDGKMQLECSLKFINDNGRAEVTAMTPEEAYAIRDEYEKIKDLPEERISFYVREINNNPTHADNYFEKIALTKEKEVELVNSETLEPEMEE